MKNFEFKSQVATSVEQSKRLLELGLKKETADMLIMSYSTEQDIIALPWSESGGWTKDNSIPAWSLHRLIETIDYPSNIDAIKELLAAKTMFNNRLYDRVIDIIEYLIQKDEFNKDYLEERK